MLFSLFLFILMVSLSARFTPMSCLQQEHHEQILGFSQAPSPESTSHITPWWTSWYNMPPTWPLFGYRRSTLNASLPVLPCGDNSRHTHHSGDHHTYLCWESMMPTVLPMYSRLCPACRPQWGRCPLPYPKASLSTIGTILLGHCLLWKSE